MEHLLELVLPAGKARDEPLSALKSRESVSEQQNHMRFMLKPVAKSAARVGSDAALPQRDPGGAGVGSVNAQAALYVAWCRMLTLAVNE